jgi:hypothetical protein
VYRSILHVMLGHRQVVERNWHVLLEDLATLVDEPCPLCRAVQVHDLLQNIAHTSPGDGPPAEMEEIW